MTTVLDKGFLEIIDHMGSDLSVVNAARVSMGKRSTEVTEKDKRLIAYLKENHHTTPFRHAYITYHVKCPIFVARQWHKHQVGCSTNEISGRYVEFENEFYIPEMFRRGATSVKQGSAEDLDSATNMTSYIVTHAAHEKALESYRTLLALGICKEQARMVLPVSLYTEFFWTASLQAVEHFLNLRSDEHAQWEIQQYARVMRELTMPLFPLTL